MASRVAAVLTAGIAVLACATTALARDATVTSFDGTPIATHFFPAANLPASGKAPTVLVGHGWGGTGATDPNGASDNVTGNTGLGPQCEPPEGLAPKDCALRYVEIVP